jgi:heme exporter protein D
MNWGSAAAFWAMGGYGFYVWGSFGAVALGFGAEVLLLKLRNRAVLQGLKRQNIAMRLEQEQPACRTGRSGARSSWAGSPRWASPPRSCSTR